MRKNTKLLISNKQIHRKRKKRNPTIKNETDQSAQCDQRHAPNKDNLETAMNNFNRHPPFL